MRTSSKVVLSNVSSKPSRVLLYWEAFPIERETELLGI